MENVISNNEVVIKVMESILKIVDFKFVNKSREFYAKKSGERELNDILEVVESDGVYYRIYLNNSNCYVEVPKNEVMLTQLKCMTWTLDNKEKNSKLVKSNSEAGKTIYLSEILKTYGYEYKVNENKYEISGISPSLYNKKRKEYKET